MYTVQTTAMDVNETSTANIDALLLLTSNCSTNASGLCSNVTTTQTTTKLLLPAGVITVIVLAAACLLLGFVYAYVYFRPTRISAMNTKKPSHKSASARQHHSEHQSGGATDPAADADGNYTTHMFLFRKHHSVNATAT